MTDLEEQYRLRRLEVLSPVASLIEERFKDILDGIPRIDRICSRAKSTDRFVAKAVSVTNGELNYKNPLVDIQDQIGVRVIVFYKSDIDRIIPEVEKYFRRIEVKSLVPESEYEFGYWGRHYLLLVPTDLVPEGRDLDCPTVFELQIKTLFQHAWAEANHDLEYKSMYGDLSSSEKRQVAFTAAQAWGADEHFDALFKARLERKSG